MVGNMYYELHPQLWGYGLMTEAFQAVLQFAMEEVGCEAVIVSLR
jgi:RimJ/RimL family protein N-acetyltransferase